MTMAALHVLRFVRPDLLDLALPQMGGLRLLGLLRATPQGASLQMAVLTASDNRGRCALAGSALAGSALAGSGCRQRDRQAPLHVAADRSAGQRAARTSAA
jgi:CheY-like chemotaxis protein